MKRQPRNHFRAVVCGFTILLVSAGILNAAELPAENNFKCVDVDGLEIDNFKAQLAEGVAMSKFENVSGAVIRNSSVLK